MRLSTYNVPRIISCAEPSDKYIALPRGCEDAITNLLDENHVSYRMNDQTELGTPNLCSIQRRELREEQVAAIKNLIPHNNGVLYGTTAFGKTVAAIGLIVERKVNTLILVHTKAPARPMENPIGRILDDRLQTRRYTTQTWTQKSIFSFWDLLIPKETIYIVW